MTVQSFEAASEERAPLLVRLRERFWRTGLKSYKGRVMGCSPGTHEAAVELVLAHVPHRSGVVDLGARSGALLARLSDLGFRDLAAIDLDRHLFNLDEVVLKTFDLNDEFSKVFERRFYLVCSSEVVEHLDSIRHFVSEAWKMIESNGYLLITVPNIANWRGRIKFMLYGEHWGFGEKHHRNARHISPTTFEEMTTTMRELGFSLVAETTAGDFDAPLKRMLTWPVRGMIRLVGGRRAEGDCAIYLFRKTKPEAALARPTWYVEEWDKSRAASQ